MDVNSLRILNDYLNQTIDALLRGQQRAAIGLPGTATQVGWPTVGWPTAGLSHSPFAAAGIFGTTTPVLDPIGLSHSPYAAFGQFGYAPTFGGPLSAAFPGGATNNPFIDPFSVQRGLSHTPYSNVAPLALEMARQQQLTQAIAARQSVLEAMCRSVGIPV